MRHTGRTMFAALAAVLALGAVGVASASAALPEFVHGTGESFPSAISGSDLTAADTFQTASGVTWLGECSGYKYSGQVTGAKSLSLTTEFKRCGSSIKSGCNTAGAGSGDVVIPGSATLVYINKASKQVGILLNLTETEVVCGGLEQLIKGSIVIPLTPINTKTSTLDLSIHGERGKQEYTSYENEKGEIKKATLQVNEGDGLLLASLNVSDLGRLTLSKPLTVDG